MGFQIPLSLHLLSSPSAQSEVPAKILHSARAVHLYYWLAVTLQTEDVGGVQGLAQEVGIALKGEAYAIDVAVKYPDPASSVVDFGLMKATLSAAKTVTLVNSGKHAVGYTFHLRGGGMKELFSISPAEGSLTPGAQQAMELTFNKYALYLLSLPATDSQHSMGADICSLTMIRKAWGSLVCHMLAPTRNIMPLHLH